MARPEWDADGQTWAEGGVAEEGTWVARAVVPGALGEHVCGTEADFRDGCPRDESIPVVKYGSSGLPQCCNPPALGDAGGAMGGRALVLWPVVPGNTCATAYDLPAGVTQTFSFPAAGSYWIRVPIAVASAWHTESSVVSGSTVGAIANAAFGPDCGSLTPHGFWSLTGCTDHLVLPAGFLFLTLTVVTPLMLDINSNAGAC